MYVTNLTHTFLDKNLIYALSKCHKLILKRKEVMLGQKIQLKIKKIETFVYDFSNDNVILPPGLTMGTYKFDYCVTTNTSQCYPYVDLIKPTFGVAIGGCGQAAHSSDEIGNMAARYVNISSSFFSFILY